MKGSAGQQVRKEAVRGGRARRQTGLLSAEAEAAGRAGPCGLLPEDEVHRWEGRRVWRRSVTRCKFLAGPAQRDPCRSISAGRKLPGRAQTKLACLLKK